MANIYQCNLCADGEGALAPCVFEVPDCLGDPNPTMCPVDGEAEWFKLTSEEQCDPKNSAKKSAALRGNQQTHDAIALLKKLMLQGLPNPDYWKLFEAAKVLEKIAQQQHA